MGKRKKDDDKEGSSPPKRRRTRAQHRQSQRNIAESIAAPSSSQAAPSSSQAAPSTSQKTDPTPGSSQAESEEAGPSNAAAAAARPSSPEPDCSICLDVLDNRSFTDSCFHTYCFICLREWSKMKAVCPLCKQSFKKIIHNVRSMDDYDEYVVPREPRAPAPFRYRTTMSIAGLPRQYNLGEVPIHRRNTASEERQRRRNRSTSAFRQSVYSKGMRVQEITTAAGQPVRYRDISPAWFRRYPASVHRLVPWLNRELNVLLRNNDTQVQDLLEMILELIRQHDIRSREFEQAVGVYLERRTDHFIHEFHMFASSPSDLANFDRNAVYHEPVGNVIQSLLSPSSNSDTADDDDVIILPSYGAPSATAGSARSGYNMELDLAGVPSQSGSHSRNPLSFSPLLRRVHDQRNTAERMEPNAMRSIAEAHQEIDRMSNERRMNERRMMNLSSTAPGPSNFWSSSNFFAPLNELASFPTFSNLSNAFDPMQQPPQPPPQHPGFTPSDFSMDDFLYDHSTSASASATATTRATATATATASASASASASTSSYQFFDYPPREDTDASSHESDIEVVGEERPWTERSPIALISSDSEGITVLDTAEEKKRKDKKKKKKARRSERDREVSPSSRRRERERRLEERLPIETPSPPSPARDISNREDSLQLRLPVVRPWVTSARSSQEHVEEREEIAQILELSQTEARRDQPSTSQRRRRSRERDNHRASSSEDRHRTSGSRSERSTVNSSRHRISRSRSREGSSSRSKSSHHGSHGSFTISHQDRSAAVEEWMPIPTLKLKRKKRSSHSRDQRDSTSKHKKSTRHHKSSSKSSRHRERIAERILDVLSSGDDTREEQATRNNNSPSKSPPTTEREILSIEKILSDLDRQQSQSQFPPLRDALSPLASPRRAIRSSVQVPSSSQAHRNPSPTRSFEFSDLFSSRRPLQEAPLDLSLGGPIEQGVNRNIRDAANINVEKSSESSSHDMNKYKSRSHSKAKKKSKKRSRSSTPQPERKGRYKDTNKHKRKHKDKKKRKDKDKEESEIKLGGGSRSSSVEVIFKKASQSKRHKRHKRHRERMESSNVDIVNLLSSDGEENSSELEVIGERRSDKALEKQKWKKNATGHKKSSATKSSTNTNTNAMTDEQPGTSSHADVAPEASSSTQRSSDSAEIAIIGSKPATKANNNTSQNPASVSSDTSISSYHSDYSDAAGSHKVGEVRDTTTTEGHGQGQAEISTNREEIIDVEAEAAAEVSVLPAGVAGSEENPMTIDQDSPDEKEKEKSKENPADKNSSSQRRNLENVSARLRRQCIDKYTASKKRDLKPSSSSSSSSSSDEDDEKTAEIKNFVKEKHQHHYWKTAMMREWTSSNRDFQPSQASTSIENNTTTNAVPSSSQTENNTSTNATPLTSQTTETNASPSAAPSQTTTENNTSTDAAAPSSSRTSEETKVHNQQDTSNQHTNAAQSSSRTSQEKDMGIEKATASNTAPSSSRASDETMVLDQQFIKALSELPNNDGSVIDICTEESTKSAEESTKSSSTTEDESQWIEVQDINPAENNVLNEAKEKPSANAGMEPVPDTDGSQSQVETVSDDESYVQQLPEATAGTIKEETVKEENDFNPQITCTSGSVHYQHKKMRSKQSNLLSLPAEEEQTMKEETVTEETMQEENDFNPQIENVQGGEEALEIKEEIRERTENESETESKERNLNAVKDELDCTESVAVSDVWSMNFDEFVTQTRTENMEEEKEESHVAHPVSASQSTSTSAEVKQTSNSGTSQTFKEGEEEEEANLLVNAENTSQSPSTSAGAKQTSNSDTKEKIEETEATEVLCVITEETRATEEEVTASGEITPLEEITASAETTSLEEITASAETTTALEEITASAETTALEEITASAETTTAEGTRAREKHTVDLSILHDNLEVAESASGMPENLIERHEMTYNERHTNVCARENEQEMETEQEQEPKHLQKQVQSENTEMELPTNTQMEQETSYQSVDFHPIEGENNSVSDFETVQDSITNSTRQDQEENEGNLPGSNLYNKSTDEDYTSYEGSRAGTSSKEDRDISLLSEDHLEGFPNASTSDLERTEEDSVRLEENSSVVVSSQDPIEIVLTNASTSDLERTEEDSMHLEENSTVVLSAEDHKKGLTSVSRSDLDMIVVEDSMLSGDNSAIALSADHIGLANASASDSYQTEDNMEDIRLPNDTSTYLSNISTSPTYQTVDEIENTTPVSASFTGPTHQTVDEIENTTPVSASFTGPTHQTVQENTSIDCDMFASSNISTHTHQPEDRTEDVSAAISASLSDLLDQCEENIDSAWSKISAVTSQTVDTVENTAREVSTSPSNISVNPSVQIMDNTETESITMPDEMVSSHSSHGNVQDTTVCDTLNQEVEEEKSHRAEHERIDNDEREEDREMIENSARDGEMIENSARDGEMIENSARDGEMSEDNETVNMSTSQMVGDNANDDDFHPNVSQEGVENIAQGEAQNEGNSQGDSLMNMTKDEQDDSATVEVDRIHDSAVHTEANTPDINVDTAVGGGDSENLGLLNGHMENNLSERESKNESDELTASTVLERINDADKERVFQMDESTFEEESQTQAIAPLDETENQTVEDYDVASKIRDLENPDFTFTSNGLNGDVSG